jgi:hypothetical protein
MIDLDKAGTAGCDGTTRLQAASKRHAASEIVVEAVMRGSFRLVKCLAAAGIAAALASGCATRTMTAGTGTAGTGATAATGTATAGTGTTATGTTATGAASGSAAMPSGKPGGKVVAAFDKRAKLVAAAWARAGLTKEWKTGLVLTDPADLVFVGGNGFATSDQKLAFLDGRLALSGQLPTAPLTGKVRWPGGGTATVRLLTAAQAYRTLATEQSCHGTPCPPPLVITGAKPDTVSLGTSRGKAIVPAWTFTAQSLASPITVAALAPGSYLTQPDHLRGLRSGGLKGFTGAGLGPVSADGRQIHVLVGKSPCDTRSGALVYETASAVVIGSWTYDPHRVEACPAVLLMESVPVKLAAPLGDRVVLSVYDGRPLTASSL